MTVEDERFMRRALVLASHTGRLGNVPVGAVVVQDGKIVGEGANLRHTLQDPTAHAEIVALRDAAKRASAWRLDEATLYVTLEPCAMCSGAILEARVARLVYGAPDTDTYTAKGKQLLSQPGGPKVQGGVLEKDCCDVLKDFFAALRES